MRFASFALIATLILAGCETTTTQGATTSPPASTVSAAGYIKYLGGDGSSLQQAILIRGAKGEFDGVKSEYDWLAINRPGWERTEVALVNNGGRVYDVLTIRKGGQTAKIYFDITEYFGKY